MAATKEPSHTTSIPHSIQYCRLKDDDSFANILFAMHTHPSASLLATGDISGNINLLDSVKTSSLFSDISLVIQRVHATSLVMWPLTNHIPQFRSCDCFLGTHIIQDKTLRLWGRLTTTREAHAEFSSFQRVEIVSITYLHPQTPPPVSLFFGFRSTKTDFHVLSNMWPTDEGGLGTTLSINVTITLKLVLVLVNCSEVSCI